VGLTDPSEPRRAVHATSASRALVGQVMIALWNGSYFGGLKCRDFPRRLQKLEGFRSDDDRLNVAVSHAVFGPDSCVSRRGYLGMRYRMPRPPKAFVEMMASVPPELGPFHI
jgi:hypothetical protein